MKRLFFALALLFSLPAHAHDWYSGKRDPVTYGLCCGGNDCGMWTIRKGNLFGSAKGYHVIMTLEETQKINRYSSKPIDAVVPWERVQESPDGNWHICLKTEDRNAPSEGVYCLFAPPNT